MSNPTAKRISANAIEVHDGNGRSFFVMNDAVRGLAHDLQAIAEEIAKEERSQEAVTEHEA